MRSWRRWRWSPKTCTCHRSLPKPLGLGAHEGRRLHRASLTSSASLHLQQHQVTSFKVLLSAGSAHRAAPFPGRVGPSPQHVSTLFMFFIYIVFPIMRLCSALLCHFKPWKFLIALFDPILEKILAFKTVSKLILTRRIRLIYIVGILYVKKFKHNQSKHVNW